MENSHWTSIGRDIARQTADMNKGQRVTHVRNCAASLGLSAHTVRRFVVLAQFAEKLGISGSRSTALHVGTMEIIYRIHDHDPTEAKAALADLLQGDLSYGAASKRLDEVGKSKREKGERTPGHDEVRKRIAEMLGVGDPAHVVELRSGNANPSRLSRSTCLYKVDKRVVTYISEAAMIAENQRGVKNLSRIILLAACESDIVVVDFMSYAFLEGFQKHTGSVCQDVRNRIRLLDVV